MDSLGTAKFKDINHTLHVRVMLAALALLLTRFLCIFGTIPLGFILMACPCDCTYARKRVVNRIIHHRKYALFPGYPNGLNSCSGTDNLRIGDVKGISEVCYKTKTTKI